MKSKSLILVLSVVLSSCASTFQYNKIAQPDSIDSEMATIYVLRTSYFGTAVKFKIYQDEKLVGKLGPKNYLAWSVKPDGKEVTIMSKSENKDMVTINPQPGQTYYIKQKLKMGVVIARTELEFMDETAGKEALLKLNGPKSKNIE